MPAAPRRQRERVRADLVGHVAVGRDPIAADDHRADLSAGDQPGGGGVDDQLVTGSRAARARTSSAARPGAAAGSRWRSPSRGGPRSAELGDHGERRAAAGRGERAGVAVGEDHAARPRAGRRRAPRSPRWPPPPRPGSRGPRPSAAAAGSAPRVATAASTRSTAWARLTAVGRASAGAVTGALERRRIPRQLERDPVRGGDADQRRAADRQPADRAGDVLGAAQLELVLARRERGLVERAQRARRRSAARPGVRLEPVLDR